MENKELAYNLLKINAVELRPQNPFTWASGIKSPIYCDNRQTLSFPDIRNFIKQSFATFIKENYPQTDVIAGVATGAIAHGVLVADELNLPFIYVRSKSKDHGKQNQIEGKFTSGQKVVVIEDLISTGGSSISAVESLRAANLDVLGLVAIFSYGFKKAEINFQAANCKFDTLTDYDTLINVAVDENFIKKSDLEILENWRKTID